VDLVGGGKFRVVESFSQFSLIIPFNVLPGINGKFRVSLLTKRLENNPPSPEPACHFDFREMV